jgi:hypothetical protein
VPDQLLERSTVGPHAVRERIGPEHRPHLVEELPAEDEAQGNGLDRVGLGDPLRLEERLEQVERDPRVTSVQVPADDVGVVDRDEAVRGEVAPSLGDGVAKGGLDDRPVPGALFALRPLDDIARAGAAVRANQRCIQLAGEARLRSAGMCSSRTPAGTWKPVAPAWLRPSPRSMNQ